MLLALSSYSTCAFDGSFCQPKFAVMKSKFAASGAQQFLRVASENAITYLNLDGSVQPRERFIVTARLEMIFFMNSVDFR